mgnify:CR=1 FL=1
MWHDSKALLTRRAHPLAPDENLPDDAARYEQRRGRVYLGRDLDLARSSTIGSTSLIGARASVGAHSVVSQSVFAPDVRVGKGCKVTGCYLFAGAVVEDDCVLEDVVVGEGARVGKGSVVTAGSLIGRGAKVGSGATLGGVRVSSVDSGEQVEVDAGASRELLLAGLRLDGS